MGESSHLARKDQLLESTSKRRRTLRWDLTTLKKQP